MDWEDNFVSNFLAYASYRLTPRWCQHEDHWSSRLAAHLFTDCPCCLLFRGLFLGGFAGFLASFVTFLIFALLFSLI